MLGELRKQGYFINKKRVQRIMQKISLPLTSFTRKSRKYSSYKGKIGKVAPNRLRRRFETKYHIKRLPQILQSLNIMILILKAV